MVVLHAAVPSQRTCSHGPLAAQLTGVPTQAPPLLQVSPKVHGFASSHELPGSGVDVHDEVPLQLRWLQASEVHVTGVPTHESLLSQASP